MRQLDLYGDSKPESSDDDSDDEISFNNFSTTVNIESDQDTFVKIVISRNINQKKPVCVM